MKRFAVVVLVFALACRALAQPAGEWTSRVTYRGQPVAGAKAALTSITYPIPGEPKYAEPVFATTDDKGEMRFPRDAEAASGGHACLLIRDKTGRGGYATLFGESQRYSPAIELHENAELAGRVTDAEGKPIRDLKLKLVALGPDNLARFGGRPVSYAATADWFWDGFAPKFTADGSFTLTGVPAGHSVAVQFEAAGFGAGRFWVFPGNTMAVALRKAGAIRLRFRIAGNAKPGDISVSVTRTGRDLLEATATGTAKAATDLTLANLPPGDYRVSFPYTGPAALFPKPAGTVTVKPGETAEMSTALEPAARLTAKMVDSNTGKGVAGAKLSLSITQAAGGWVGNVKADAAGKIDVLVPPGMISITPMTIAGYTPRKVANNPFNTFSTEPLPVAPGQTRDFGSFALVKTVDVTGIVVDEDDKPVARARVEAGYSGTNSAAGTTTATDGTFVLKGANPEGGVFGITAHKGDLITAAPVAVDAGKLNGVVRVVVSAKYGARVRVRAVDRAGKPIAGVGIELAHSVSYLSRGAGITGSGTGRKVGATDAAGRFESVVLQAGDQYSITLSAPGYRGANAPDWMAKPGETHDYGDVVLTRSELPVSGTVTDLTGIPVAGATVFNNADGPRPTTTKTDGAGRFTLTGLHEGPAFLSVRADGFRLVSVAASPGGPALAVTLRRTSESPAAPPGISDQHKAATEKLTRHLLETMWANRVAAGDDGKLVIRAMAKFDPPTARKWRDEEKTRTNGTINLTSEIETADRERTLLKTAKEDPDEAVALLRPVTGVEGFRSVCALARQLIADSPDKSLRIAEEAVARARGLDEDQRTRTLAQAGELVWLAGKKDAGRKLIEQAAALAEPLGYADLDGYRRGMVACRVALYDPAECRKMIDPIKEAREFNRYLAQACSRLAESDLPLARKWLADFRPDNSFAKHTAGALVAYRVVRTNPDDAIAVAQSIEDRTIRATTLAGLALRLRDRDKAVRLIDAAMDGIVADPTGYYNGGGSGTAALVLYRAKQIGHPDLACLRDKVLAARPASRDGAFSRANGPDVTDAVALALTDPTTARDLLATRLLPGDLTALENLRNREPLLALALADPAAALRPVDELIGNAVARKKGYQYTGLDKLASVLCWPDRVGGVAESALRAGWFLGDFEEE
jgi:hypothetical protein